MLRCLARSATGLTLAFVLSSSASAEQGSGAAGTIERAGCRVRTENIDERGVATVAAECHWAVATEAVLATLRNPGKLGEALSSLAECRRLPDGRVLQVHAVGWPLEDRQVTLEWREAALEGGGLRIHVQRAELQEPLVAGRSAILESEGRWEIHPDGAGGTRLSYQSRYDAGGNLKPWLVRRFQKDGVATSLEELRSAVASR
jgi:Polyketide cyclase / dehydrase and lipid transport